jgi:phosphoglycolate phosphatase
MRMARAARVKAIGVAWGYHEAAELSTEGADIVIDDFALLDGAIDQLVGPARA